MKNNYSEYCDYKKGAEFAELRKAIVIKRIPKIIYFLLYEAAFVAFGYIWGRFTNFGSGAAAMVLCGLLGLSGLKVFGLIQMLSDRFYEGKIIRIDEKTVEADKTAFGQMMNFNKQRQTFDLYIELKNGDVKLVKMDCSTDIPHDYYKIGDEVRHYPGLKLFEKRDKTGDEKIICNNCENYLNFSEEVCPFCGAKLLK